MNNGMLAEAAKVLSELIPSTGNFKVLYFHNNMIGDEGVMSIVEMVKHSPKLESSRCSTASIGSDGVVALAEALGTCIHLEKLDLSDNVYCGDVAIGLRTSLAKLTEFTEHLCLCKRSLESKCRIAMIIVLEQLILRDLAEELSLKTPTLAENELNAHGAMSTEKLLEHAYKDLKKLDV
jgi:Ran GTPase-activating protein 1